jgi:hypothetical protein
MKNVHISTHKKLDRRHMLRAGGVSLALPFLDAMTPAFAATPAGHPKAKRFVSASLALGLHGPNWTPNEKGTSYKPAPYLQPLQDLRKDMTIVSGSSHPRVTGGHTAEGSILTACPNTRGSTSRNTISVDQLMARHLGHETRFPSLVLNTGGSTSPSYTENGAMIPAEEDIAKLFAKLFINDSPKEQARQAALLQRGRSILDIIGDEARSLKRELGPGDQDKLDAWFTSVRDLETRLEMNKNWIHRPKPKAESTAPKPDRNNSIEVVRAMFDIVALALQTDSTRFVTLHMPGNAKLKGVKGITEGYHGLSHHGKDEEKLLQLARVEQAVINEWARFLRKLKSSALLDTTMVLLTSNLGNASSHNNKNLPVLFAGGGFKHGRHLAFNQKNNYPLPNLYLNALHQVGLPFESFATSTGEMTGLV